MLHNNPSYSGTKEKITINDIILRCFKISIQQWIAHKSRTVSHDTCIGNLYGIAGMATIIAVVVNFWLHVEWQRWHGTWKAYGTTDKQIRSKIHTWEKCWQNRIRLRSLQTKVNWWKYSVQTFTNSRKFWKKHSFTSFALHRRNVQRETVIRVDAVKWCVCRLRWRFLWWCFHN